jgi:hypothetical protein
MPHLPHIITTVELMIDAGKFWQQKSICEKNAKYKIYPKFKSKAHSHHQALLFRLQHPLVRVHAGRGDAQRLRPARRHPGSPRGQVPALRTPRGHAERLWPPSEVLLVESVLLILPRVKVSLLP